MENDFPLVFHAIYIEMRKQILALLFPILTGMGILFLCFWNPETAYAKSTLYGIAILSTVAIIAISGWLYYQYASIDTTCELKEDEIVFYFSEKSLFYPDVTLIWRWEDMKKCIAKEEKGFKTYVLHVQNPAKVIILHCIFEEKEEVSVRYLFSRKTEFIQQ